MQLTVHGSGQNFDTSCFGMLLRQLNTDETEGLVMSPNGYHTHIDCCLLSRSMSSSIHVGMHPLPFLSSLLSCLSFSFNYSCDLFCSEKPFMMHRRIQFLNSNQQVSVVYCKNVLCILCELKGQPNDHICIYIESYLSIGSHV